MRRHHHHGVVDDAGARRPRHRRDHQPLHGGFDPLLWPVREAGAADGDVARSRLSGRLAAGGDLPVRHRQRAGDLHGVHRPVLHDDARHHHADRFGQSQLHQRRAHDGRQQAPDLHPRDPAGDPAGLARGASSQFVRRVDGGAGRRGDRRRLRARTDHLDGPQHVQPRARLLHHRHHRSARLHLRLWRCGCCSGACCSGFPRAREGWAVVDAPRVERRGPRGQLRRRRQGVECGEQAGARGVDRHRSRDRSWRVRRSARPVRLRQEHAALSHRRARSSRPRARSARTANPSPDLRPSAA